MVRDLPVARPVPDPLAEVWAGLYDCPLSAACHDIHFDPPAGLVPRGIWSPPSLDRVGLLVVAHNPGTPRPGEPEHFQRTLPGRPRMELASGYTYDSFAHGSRKAYHGRLLRVLCEALADTQPLTPAEALDRVVFTNLVKCALRGGPGTRVLPGTLATCTSAYLSNEVAALPGIPVLAVGSPARSWAQANLPAGRWAAIRHPSYRGWNHNAHICAVAAIRSLLGRGGTVADPTASVAIERREEQDARSATTSADEVVAVRQRLSRGAQALPAWLADVRAACIETLSVGEVEAIPRVEYVAVRPRGQSRRNWAYLVAVPAQDPDTIEIRFIVPPGSQLAGEAEAALRSAYPVALVEPESRHGWRVVVAVGTQDAARTELLRQWARRLYKEFQTATSR